MLNSLKMQYLSKKAVKSIITALELRRDIDYGFIEMLRKAEEVKAIYSDKYELIVFDNITALFKVQGKDVYIPTLYVINMLYNTRKMLITPTVVVDEGAVTPLKKGADVMIPGIKKIIKSFSKGDIVAVMEPGERYLIVVGIALVDSSAIAPSVKGKGIENISRIDDEIWTISLQVARALAK